MGFLSDYKINSTLNEVDLEMQEFRQRVREKHLAQWVTELNEASKNNPTEQEILEAFSSLKKVSNKLNKHLEPTTIDEGFSLERAIPKGVVIKSLSVLKNAEKKMLKGLPVEEQLDILRKMILAVGAISAVNIVNDKGSLSRIISLMSI
jgi:uncharacterized FlaG/YvyC family protein